MSAPAVENKGVPTLKSVQRITSIPLVADGINYAYSLTQSTALTAKLFATGNGVINTVWSGVEPVVGYGRPLIETADGLANKTLDVVESRFPYPFKTPTGEVYADYVKKPTDKAYSVSKNVYDTRVAPLHLDQNIVISKALEATHLLLDQLKKAQDGTVDVAYKSVNSVQATSKELLDQLNKLTSTGSAQINETIKQTTADFKEIINKDVPLTEKSKDIIHYITNSLTPVLDTAKSYVFAAKKETEEKANEAKGKAEEVANNHS